VQVHAETVSLFSCFLVQQTTNKYNQVKNLIFSTGNPPGGQFVLRHIWSVHTGRISKPSWPFNLLQLCIDKFSYLA